VESVEEKVVNRKEMRSSADAKSRMNTCKNYDGSVILRFGKWLVTAEKHRLDSALVSSLKPGLRPGTSGSL
jgi:hypothetical protein